MRQIQTQVKRKPKDPKKALSISKLKKEAWKWFSLWTRLRYATEEGYVMCVTCNATRHFKDNMQAGHAFSGRGNSILFNEELVYPQCFGCNIMNSGRLDVFQKFLIDKYGLEKWEELLRLKNTPKKFTQEELLGLIEKHKLLVKEDNRYEP